MKRVLCIILALVLCVGMVPTTAFAAEGDEVRDSPEIVAEGSAPVAPSGQNPTPVVPDTPAEQDPAPVVPDTPAEQDPAPADSNTPAEQDPTPVVPEDPETQTDTEKFADVSEFEAAIDKIGDATDEASTRAAIAECLDVYARLSPEDQKAKAADYAYIQSFAEDFGQSEIDTLAYDPTRTIYLYINRNGGSVAYARLKWSQVSGKTLDYVVKTYFPNYYKAGNSYLHRSNSYGSWSNRTYVEDTAFQDILIDNWHEHNYVWTSISDTQHQLKCSCGQTNGYPQSHSRFVQSSTPATCHSYASTTYYCSTCGHTWTEYGNTYVKHTWGEWYDNGKGQEQRDCNFGVHHEYRDIQTKDVTLSYNANGGIGAPASQTQKTTGPSATITISSQVPTRPGDTFLGWATTADAASEQFYPGGQITISSNTTLYAVWEYETVQKPYTIIKVFNGIEASEIPGNYTLTYKLANDGGEGTLTAGTATRTTVSGSPALKWDVQVYVPSNTATNTKVAITESNFKISGYDWSSNYFSKTGEANREIGGGTLKSTDYLYNDYTKSVVDNGNGISVTKTRTSGDTAGKGDVITWEVRITNNSNVEKKITVSERLTGAYFDPAISNPVTFAAGETKTFTVKYTVKDTDAGTIINTVSADTGDTGDNEYKEVTDEPGTKVKASYTVKWFDVNGDTIKASETRNGSGTASVTEGDKQVKGYTFRERDDRNVLTDNVKADGSTVLSLYFDKEQETVTATWKNGYDDNPIHTVTVSKDISDADLKAKYPANPTRPGFEFAGWKDPERDNEGNITITAQWKPKDETITVSYTLTKVFEGIEKSQVPSNFKMEYNLNDTGFITLTNPAISEDEYGNSITMQWNLRLTIPKDAKSRITFKESNYMIDGYSWTSSFESGAEVTDEFRTDTKLWIVNNYTPLQDNGAGITVEKKRSSITRDGKEVAPENIQVGDTINWDITVTNKSNVKKTVTLTDELTIGTDKQYLALYPNTVELNPSGEEGDSQIVTVSYTVRASDVGKAIKNAVQATTGEEGEKENPKADDGDGTKIPDPIEITKTRTSVTRDGKTVDVKDIQVGDRINYAITVKNNTNLALTSLKLVEGNGKFVTSWAGVKFEETSLENVIIPAGGESTFEAFHEVTAADLDTFVINTVTAILDGMEFKASDDGTKIPSLKIKVDNVTVTYDGEGHGIQVEANVDCAVTYTDKRGNTIEGLPTDAGEYTATVTYRDGDKTMTVTGKVTIKKAELTITTASAKKYYDGKALTKDAYEVKGLVNGETVKVTVTGSQTKVGSSANTCTIEWADGTTSVTRMAREAAPTAKQSNYTLNANLGTLTVKRASSGGGWDNVPKTGDSGVTAIFSSLLFLALAGTACAWVYDRKRTRR